MNNDEFQGGARYVGGKVEKTIGDSVSSRDWQVDGIVSECAGLRRTMLGTRLEWRAVTAFAATSATTAPPAAPGAATAIARPVAIVASAVHRLLIVAAALIDGNLVNKGARRRFDADSGAGRPERRLTVGQQPAETVGLGDADRSGVQSGAGGDEERRR